MRTLIVGCMAIFTCISLFGRELNDNHTYIQTDTIAPEVFILGENENLENVLDKQYPEGIIDAYGGNAQAAFADWAEMLRTMDAYAEAEGQDIKGIKAFARIYCNQYGKIEHIAYSLKARSRYLKPKVLDSFFVQFIDYYNFDVEASSNFQHTFTLALPYPLIRKKETSLVEK